MANVVINDAHLSNIASAIREKNGSSVSYKPREMAEAIALLDTTSGDGDLTFSKTGIVELDYNATIIPEGAFQGCSNLKVFRSNATTVGMAAFANCGSLKKVYLRNAVNVGKPANEIYYDYDPFYRCPITHIDFGENIEYINLKNMKTTLNSIVIRKTALNIDGTFTLPTLIVDYIPVDQRADRTIYVPSEVKSFYEAAQATASGVNYSYFHLETIEGSGCETYGGDLD